VKLLVVASKYPPEYAGAGFRIHGLLRRLCATWPELNVNVITGGLERLGSAAYIQDGFSVNRVAAKSPIGMGRFGFAVRYWRDVLATRRLMERVAPDMVYVFGMAGPTAAAIHWARARKLPLIVELVTRDATPYQSFPGCRSTAGLDLHNGTCVIAISEHLRRTCEAAGLADNVWNRPNPVDTDRFQPLAGNRGALRAQMGLFGPDDVVVSMVAKLMPQKNQIFLLDVLRHLPDSFKLVLAGPLVESGPLAERDAAYVATIRDKTVEAGLESRVLLRPGFADAAAIMQASDVYVLPNTNEGLGTPMLESIACGVPVVANAGEAAFAQWVREGENGFLRPLETGAWADAIQAAAEIPSDVRQAQSEAVRATASQVATDTAYRRLMEALLAGGGVQPLRVADVFAGEAAHG